MCILRLSLHELVIYVTFDEGVHFLKPLFTPRVLSLLHNQPLILFEIELILKLYITLLWSTGIS